jgi:predicted Zn finger-like uncharacterized protein
MFTYCPSCKAVFQVSATQLSLAGGKVRCGECREIYTATEFLYDDLAAIRSVLGVKSETTGQEASVPPVDYVRLPDVEQVVEQEVAPAAPQRLGGWEQNTFSLREVFSGVWIIFLLLLLGIQYVWFNRDALAADDAWRPTVERFCGVLGCAVPLRSESDQLAITSRDVRQHPTTDGALLINASFENRADFVQRYPVFEIIFTDSDGGPVARRRFLPNEYLADGAAVAGGLSPDATVQVVLEVMDPGDQAISFQFGFL